jgi:hypothetical protein
MGTKHLNLAAVSGMAAALVSAYVMFEVIFWAAGAIMRAT